MALARLIDEKFGVRTRVNENPVTDVVGVGAVKILNNNPDRLGFIIVNLGAFDLCVGLDGSVNSFKCVRLPATGGILTAYYGEDFAFVGREIWAVAPWGANNVYVLEVEAE